MADPRVTIIGATGAVGKIALEVLSQRNFAMSNLRLTASERSVGKKIDFAGTSITVGPSVSKSSCMKLYIVSVLASGIWSNNPSWDICKSLF